MKKFLRLVSLILAAVMILSTAGCALIGCDEPAPDITLKQLEGTWTREVEKTKSSYTETYTFSKTMKYTKVNDVGPTDGTFTIEGNTITLNNAMSKDPTTHIVRFYDDDNTMKWGNGNVTSIFTRVGKKKK